VRGHLTSILARRLSIVDFHSSFRPTNPCCGMMRTGSPTGGRKHKKQKTSEVL
jgi:hypothetical protein